MLTFLADNQANNAPVQWWTVVGGILAIPTAVLGLAYTVVLIRKSGLESEKMQLEIIELRKKLEEAGSADGQGNASKILAEPIIENRRVQELLLRFVLFFIILQLWEMATRIFNVVGSDFHFFVGLVFDAGYNFVLLALGGSIAVDVLRQLNIGIPKWIAKVYVMPRAGYVLLFVGSVFIAFVMRILTGLSSG